MTFNTFEVKSHREVQAYGGNASGRGASAIVILMMSLVFGPIALVHLSLLAASQPDAGLGRLASAVHTLLPQVFGVN